MLCCTVLCRRGYGAQRRGGVFERLSRDSGRYDSRDRCGGQQQFGGGRMGRGRGGGGRGGRGDFEGEPRWVGLLFVCLSGNMGGGELRGGWRRAELAGLHVCDALGQVEEGWWSGGITGAANEDSVTTRGSQGVCCGRSFGGALQGKGIRRSSEGAEAGLQVCDRGVGAAWWSG
mgnify:FL=1